MTLYDFISAIIKINAEESKLQELKAYIENLMDDVVKNSHYLEVSIPVSAFALVIGPKGSLIIVDSASNCSSLLHFISNHHSLRSLMYHIWEQVRRQKKFNNQQVADLSWIVIVTLPFCEEGMLYQLSITVSVFRTSSISISVENCERGYDMIADILDNEGFTAEKLEFKAKPPVEVAPIKVEAQPPVVEAPPPLPAVPKVRSLS
jgi:hypothetical protein